MISELLERLGEKAPEIEPQVRYSEVNREMKRKSSVWKAIGDALQSLAGKDS
jgi:hypothetical protein